MIDFSPRCTPYQVHEPDGCPTGIAGIGIWNTEMKPWFNPFNCFRKKTPRPGKKVLVLEGGGMRGIFLTGVLQGFWDRHFFPWKLIIGSSAGALTGAAYAAGQIHLARDAFFTLLTTKNFISLFNVLNREKHILDMDWLADTIIGGEDPLDVERLKKSCQVIITASHIGDQGPPKKVYLDTRKDDILTALKASAAVPFLYRGFVQYKDYNLLDGALLDPVPFHKARDMGFEDKHILVVASRNRKYRKKQESFWVKTLYENYYKDEKYACLLEALENRYIKYNKLMEDLYENHPDISVIDPPLDFRLSRLTRDRDELLKGFELGITAAKNWLKNR